VSKFQFRLQTLLRLKIADRDRCRGELAEILQAEQRLKEQQADLENELVEQFAYARQVSLRGEIDLMVASQRQLAFLKAGIAEKQQIMQQLAPHIQQRREALVEADKEVRTLERLKELKQEEHEKRLLVLEAKQLDEFAISSHTRKGI